MTEAPKNISFWHPAMLLGTWFGAGLSRWAPGTVGSTAAIPFGILILFFYGSNILLLASLICFVIGCWACEIYGRRTDKKDASELVIDEVAGMWLVMWGCMPLMPQFLAKLYIILLQPQEFVPSDTAHYFNLLALAYCFFGFRFFDIIKPWPASWADRKVKGGFGVMLDDIFAALFPVILFWISYWALTKFYSGFGYSSFIDG